MGPGVPLGGPKGLRGSTRGAQCCATEPPLMQLFVLLQLLVLDLTDDDSQVRGKKLHEFTGGYNKFLSQRKERDAQLTAQAQAQADEIARLQVFVDRFGAKVRG